MIRKIKLLLLITVFAIGTAVADEGMWLPSLIHKLNINTMQQMGCELSRITSYNVCYTKLLRGKSQFFRGLEVLLRDSLPKNHLPGSRAQRSNVVGFRQNHSGGLSATIRLLK